MELIQLHILMEWTQLYLLMEWGDTPLYSLTAYLRYPLFIHCLIASLSLAAYVHVHLISVFT
jgi:hypothetical protein